jgi:hypothetical protein
MPTLIAGIVAVIVLYLALQAFRRADARYLAKVFKLAAGILALAAAAYIGVRGQVFVAAPLGLFGLGLLGWEPAKKLDVLGWFTGRGGQGGGQTSRLRTACLEVEFSRASGQMTGTILAGPFAGRDLDSLALAELTGLRAGFDRDSAALLEAYLDRRFPGWRDHAQADDAARGSRSAARGKMTEDEAYEILGLKAGASMAEISRAHRALMKKLHPDQGGSTYLAARVNEAKDFLVRTHRK